jgi:predicted phage tail protein
MEKAIVTILIIDESKAQDIFAGLCQEMEKLRNVVQYEHSDFFMAGSSTAKNNVNLQLNVLSGVIAEVEAMLSRAPKSEFSLVTMVLAAQAVFTSSPIPEVSTLKRSGRPKMTELQRQMKIDELTILKNTAKDYQEKLRLGKIIRRLRRSTEE